MHATIRQMRRAMTDMRSMTRALPTAAMLLLLVAGAAAAGEPAGPEGPDAEIVARVNGESVTRGELQRLLLDPVSQRRLQQELGVRMVDSRALDHLAVQTLIHRHLMLQEASRRNITLTEQDLDQALLDLRRRFKDLKEFGAWMQSRGLNDKSLRDTIRIDLLMRRVREALIGNVRVSDKDVEEYYEAHKHDPRSGDKLRLRLIAVKDKAAADEIMAALRIGADFSRLARQRSLGVRAKQGGDTGWVDAVQVPPLLRETVTSLSVGETRGPVQNGDHFLIVRLEGRRTAPVRSLADVRPEIERRLLATKQQEFLQVWLAGQERTSTIEVFLSPGSFTTNGQPSAASLQRQK